MVSVTFYSFTLSKHTLNRRGGMIGEHFVNDSFTPAIISVTPPTTSKTMVDTCDPRNLM